MKIGDEVLIHGFVDEIRKDTVIIKNAGGYFGTVPEEIREVKVNQKKCSTCRYFAGAVFQNGSGITCKHKALLPKIDGSTAAFIFDRYPEEYTSCKYWEEEILGAKMKEGENP